MSRLEELRASPFFGVEIGLATQAPDFIDPFNGWLVIHDDYSPEERLGQILCSAVIHGALLDRSTWQPWLKLVSRRSAGSRLNWFNFKTECARSPTGYRNRQWFADPITSLLLKKHASAIRDDDLASTADDCLLAFLDRRHRHQFRRFDQSAIDTLLDWAIMQWRLRMPALLVDQALGNCQTTALSQASYGKIVNEVFVEIPTDGVDFDDLPEDDFTASKPWFVSFRKRETPEGRVFEHARKLRHVSEFSLRRIKPICASWLLDCKSPRTGQKSQIGPARAALIDWCIAQLTLRRGRMPQGYSPYTVENKLIAILEGVFAGKLPETLEDLRPSAIIARMRVSCAHDVEPARRDLMRRATFDYLRFAQSAEKWAARRRLQSSKSTIGLGPADDENEMKEGVAAEIISDFEFSRCLTYARKVDKSGELALMIMLGFRAGLRIGEIVGLETSDFAISDEHFELHVQKNHYRPLKTEESRRIIPLDVLFPKHELELLRKWLASRSRGSNAKKSKAKPYLCFGPAGGTILPSAFSYKRRIDTILRKVTARNVTFHSLRHSFSSYVSLKLLMPEPLSELLIPKSFRNLVTWEHSRILHNRLIGRGALGQSIMHAVSMLMGHTGTPRTLKSYQHLLDLAVHLYCCRSGTQIPIASSIRDELEDGNRHNQVRNSDLVEKKFIPRYVESVKLTFPHLEEERPVAWLPLHKERKGSFKFSGRQSAPFRKLNYLPSLEPSKHTYPWRQIFNVVTATADSEEAQRLANSFGAAKVRKWLDSHLFLFGNAPRPNRPARLYPPRGRIAQEIVERMWRCKHQLKAPEKSLLREYLEGFTLSSASCRFTDEARAIDFAALLRRLGIPGEHIGIAFGSKEDLRACQKHADRMEVIFSDADVASGQGREALFRISSERPVRRPQSSKRPALWISYVKLEADELGWSFSRQHRLDGLQELRDQGIRVAGEKLSPRRESASERRKERASKSDELGATGKSAYQAGTGAYLFGLQMIAIYHGITD